MHLEVLKNNAVIRSLLPDNLVTVVSVRWVGSKALELSYKPPDGKVGNELTAHAPEPSGRLLKILPFHFPL